MSQVQNLLDMFRNTRKDAQAKSAKAPDVKGQAAAKGSRNLLPLDTMDKSAIGAPAPKSFHDKVLESRSKLAAKAHSQAAQNQGPEAEPARDAGKGKEADRSAAGRLSRSARDERSARSDRAERSDRADRREAADGAEAQDAADGSRKLARQDRELKQSRKDGGKADAENPGCAEAQALDAASQGLRNAPAPDESLPQAPSQSEADLDRLKEGLESLGIQADADQLQDPTFLADLLQMLQILPLQNAPAPEAGTESAESPSDAVAQAAPAATEAAQQSNGNQAPAADMIASEAAAEAKTAPADEEMPALPGADLDRGESKSADRKEIAALIRDRIRELTHPDAGNQEPQADAAAIANVGRNAPASAEWQGIKLRPQADSAPTQALPMADLDRMRVLQAAALQAGNAGKESVPAPGAGNAENHEAVEAAQDAGSPAAYADRADESLGGSRAGDSDRDPDLFGKNGEAFRGAETAAPKDAAASTKDGAAVPQFQANLEQARSVEHRAGVQHAWEPRSASEPSALEQIARKMAAIGHKNGEEINIQLSPEHLGKVRVSLEMKDGAMSARIGVENDDIRKQVEAGISGLKEALENQGIKLQGMEVSVDQRHGSLFNPDGSNAESFFHRNGSGPQASGGEAAETAPFESAPESDTGRRWGYNTMEYIG